MDDALDLVDGPKETVAPQDQGLRASSGGGDIAREDEAGAGRLIGKDDGVDARRAGKVEDLRRRLPCADIVKRPGYRGAADTDQARVRSGAGDTIVEGAEVTDR